MGKYSIFNVQYSMFNGNTVELSNEIQFIIQNS